MTTNTSPEIDSAELTGYTEGTSGEQGIGDTFMSQNVNSRTMTIFLEQTYLDNEALISGLTKCGNVNKLCIASNSYWAVKATSWANTLIVDIPDQFTSAFTELNNGNVESLTMRIPLFLQLKQDTDVTKDGHLITSNGVPITIFNQVIGV